MPSKIRLPYSREAHSKYGSSTPLFMSITEWKSPENKKTPKSPPNANVPLVTQSILKECHATKDTDKADISSKWSKGHHGNQMPS